MAMASLVGAVNLTVGYGANASDDPEDDGAESAASPDQLPAGDPLGTVKVIITVLFTLVFVVGVLGNILVIVAATGRLRGLQKSMSVFVLNLSVADLLYLLVCLPFQATVITLPYWLFGEFMCKAVQFLTYASMCASIFTLVAMSLDRYLAVAHPLRFFGLRSTRNSVLLLVLIWALAAACSAPFLHVFVTVADPTAPVVYCGEGGWGGRAQRRRYYAFLFTACYMLPLLMMTVSYLLILKTLWHTFRPSGGGTSTSGGGGGLSEGPHHAGEEGDSSAQRAKKKVTVIVSVVVLAFGVCWLPHHVLYMWINFGDFPFTDGTLALKLTAVTLSSLNSSLNPIIYSILSENFRQALRRCLRRCTSSRERTKVVPRHYRIKLLRSKRTFQV